MPQNVGIGLLCLVHVSDGGSKAMHAFPGPLTRLVVWRREGSLTDALRPLVSTQIRHLSALAPPAWSDANALSRCREISVAFGEFFIRLGTQAGHGRADVGFGPDMYISVADVLQ
jgi:hypothetical protein